MRARLLGLSAFFFFLLVGCAGDFAPAAVGRQNGFHGGKATALVATNPCANGAEGQFKVGGSIFECTGHGAYEIVTSARPNCSWQGALTVCPR